MHEKLKKPEIISLHVYNNSPYQITLPLGLIENCEINATTSPTKEVAYRINNILQLLDIQQSTILDEELSINNLISNEKRNTDYFTKTPYFKPTFKISPYTEQQEKLTQKDFEKLADLLLKYPTVCATSKFDVGKMNSPLHLTFKPDAFSKNKEQVKYRFIYMTKSINYSTF